MRATSVLVPAVLAAVLGGTAAASANECETVAAAYDKLGKTAGYRQTVAMPDMETLEMVAIGDTLYIKQSKDWQKVDLKPGMRAEMMKKIIPDAAALKECVRIGPDTVDGVAAVIYGYTPPLLKGAPPMGPQQVWIGDESGLPLRMTADKADLKLSFDDVKPPM